MQILIGILVILFLVVLIVVFILIAGILILRAIELAGEIKDEIEYRREKE